MNLVSISDYALLAALFHQIPTIGQQSVRKLISYLRESGIKPEHIWEQNLAELLKYACVKIDNYSFKNYINESKICSLKKLLKKKKIQVMLEGGNEYPSELMRLDSRPFILYVLGDIHALRHPSLAVVGARRCTPYGVRATKQLIVDCGARGVESIVSGLMYGIDAVAHETALAANIPTVAVLGYGITHWYPTGINQLGERIVSQGGLLVSEYPPGMKPAKGTFLERNRIVAALADAVLVPEAADRSGTQRTVGVAADLGIPVGAVPGAFDSPMSQGTKAFVNQGAILVTSAIDILSELGLTELLPQHKSAHSQLHPIEVCLQSCAMTTDQLSLTLQQSVVQLSFELSSLELAGRIVRRGAEWYRR